jgi:hypothetical protein
MKFSMTQHYPIVGEWRILLWGFRENPRIALQQVGACALIFALMFGALFLKEILIWIERIIG